MFKNAKKLVGLAEENKRHTSGLTVRVATTVPQSNIRTLSTQNAKFSHYNKSAAEKTFAGLMARDSLGRVGRSYHFKCFYFIFLNQLDGACGEDYDCLELC